MSFFMLNNCKFKNCGRHFHTLYDLIVHIEDTHIDFDPKVMEEKEKQKHQFVPMSYILRFNRDERKEADSSIAVKEELINISDIKTEAPEFDNTVVDNDDHFRNPQWHPRSPTKVDENDLQKGKTKRFCCPVAGCTKRYKNQNGMKYHIMNYHDMRGNLVKPKKEHKCHCGREYKTLRGLQSHMLSHKDTTNVRPMMKLDHFKMRQSFPSLMPKINPNCMLPNMYSPVDNYNHLIIKNEDHQLGYPVGRNMLGNENPSTFVRTHVYPNPFYTDYGFENPNDIFVRVE